MVIGGNDFQSVAAHAKRAAVEVVIVAFVMHFHQTADQIIHGQALPHFHGNDHLGVVFRRAQSVDAGHRGHDNHITPGQQGMSGRMAQLVYIVVNGGIFFNIGIRGRHIGFGLVVVVIAHKIFHGIARKKFAELVVELGRQRLVGRENQGRTVAAGDDVGHGKGLARSGHAQQHLGRHAGQNILAQGGNGPGLIAHGGIVGLQTERNGCVIFHKDWF